MNFNLNTISLATIAAWPIKLKLGFITFACLMIMYLGYCLLIRSELHTLTRTRMKTRELQVIVRHKLQQTNELPRLTRQYTELQHRVVQMLKPLSSATTMANILSMITTTANKYEVIIKGFKPQIMQATSKAGLPDVQISLIGCYQQIALFIKQLMSSKQMITIKQFTLMRVRDKGLTKKHHAPLQNQHGHLTLQLTMTLKPYPFIDLTALTQAQQIWPLSNPFQRTQSTIASITQQWSGLANTSLTEFALSDLRYIGNIHQGRLWWAIIMTPNKMIYRVSRGDIIGLQHAKVIALERAQLKLRTSDHSQIITVSKYGE